MPYYTGPYRVTKTINDWANEAQHFVIAKKSEIHTSPLQFSSDNELHGHIS